MDTFDDLDNIITLKDDDGNDTPFEFLDVIEYEDEEYPEEADPSDSSVGFTKDGGTTYIKIALPSDRSSVNVRVTVAGNTLYDSSVNCNRDSFTVHASYSGTERVQVTMDGQTIYDGDYNFAS